MIHDVSYTCFVLIPVPRTKGFYRFGTAIWDHNYWYSSGVWTPGRMRFISSMTIAMPTFWGTKRGREIPEFRRESLVYTFLDHQDYYVFSRDPYNLWTFIYHCYWEGATPKVLYIHLKCSDTNRIRMNKMNNTAKISLTQTTFLISPWTGDHIPAAFWNLKAACIEYLNYISWHAMKRLLHCFVTLGRLEQKHQFTVVSRARKEGDILGWRPPIPSSWY